MDERPEELAERLRKLEEEAAALREALAAKASEEPDQTDPSDEPAEPEQEVEDEQEPLDPGALDKLDRLLQRYRLEKSRGNADIAAQYLKEAQELGGRTSLVLEILGDDALERRQMKEALEFYERAMHAEPKSISVEKKHADLVFRTRAKSAGLMMTSEFENVASARSATVLSMIVPGLGHLVTGDIGVGIAYLGTYIGAFVWVILTPNGIQGLIAMVSNRSEPALNGLVFVPLFLMVVIWFSSMIAMSTRAKMVGRRLEKIERPQPPADKPFE